MDSEREGDARTTCKRHPSVITYLRCGRCETPICPKCLVQTLVGARCPECARPARVGRPLPIMSHCWATLAAFGLGACTGLFMAFTPFGGFAMIPILLGGLLVGEAVSSIGRRLPNRYLAGVAFCGASLGPLIGQASAFLLITGAVSPLNGLFALQLSMQMLGPFGLLLLVGAGILASTRVSNR